MLTAAACFTGRSRQGRRPRSQGGQGEGCWTRQPLDRTWRNPRWVQVWFLNTSVLPFRDLQEQKETRDIQEIRACLETLESQEGRATRA